MSFPIVRAAAGAEGSDDLHMARLLVLLAAAGGRRQQPVAGIMKLAKLDFLLRYPNCLAHTLTVTGRDPTSAAIQPHEENSIESRMVRFRYGPWDKRYRRWIALLVAKGLGNTYCKGRTVYVGLTDEGKRLADGLAESQEFGDLATRASLIAKAVGGLSATALKDFVYREFPEIVAMRWGEEIEL